MDLLKRNHIAATPLVLLEPLSRNEDMDSAPNMVTETSHPIGKIGKENMVHDRTDLFNALSLVLTGAFQHREEYRFRTAVVMQER